MTNTKKRSFDEEAASWDEKPGRIQLAKDIVHAISKEIVLTPEMDVMDFGCGTGLLTIQLAPFVRAITGVDNSRGMLDVFNAKIAERKLDTVNTVFMDLDRGDTLTGRYDLVLSNMTVHHIKEIAPLFEQFHQITAPGGYLCISDLDLDDGRFHDDNSGVFHFGFDRINLRRVFAEAGFDDIRDTDAAAVMKPDVDGEIRRFTVFLMTGRKR
ncbi:MAG: class I SAM-dependent methyltransferase [Gammaproteobacteria bacterium]|nr:class I SAM-dependent methyltransferase [Gammaproteobacteria bacterium]NNJ83346.1 class I SAM-dependent methyltransferase [Gammaproteobacteria bacterium]